MSLTAYPTLRLKLTMPQALKLQFLPAIPGSNAAAAAALAIAAAQQAQSAANTAVAATANKVDKAGDIMTGFLQLNADPVANLQAATKHYVDTHTGTGGIPDAPSDGTTYGRNNAAWVNVQPLDADLTSLAGATGTGTTGVYYRKAANSWATLNIGTGLSLNTGTDTLTATAAGVSDGDKGDITVSGGGATWTIDAQAVTYAKIQNVTTARIHGRITAGSGSTEELTGTQVTTLLDAFTSTLKGVAPASGGGTANFLRADGTWATPATGGAPTTAEYITASTDATLSNERVLTNTASVIWDFTTPGQAKATATGGGGGTLPPDGTYTDIAVSGTGTIWTIRPAVVTYSKIQNVSVTNRFLGRITAGSGSTEELTGANAKTIIGSGDLTKTDDTNVTLTLGGTPAAALYSAVSLTLGWTGTLSVARGGLGVGTITGLMQGNGTGAVTGVTNSSTVGQVLRVTGASTYAWGALDLADTDATTGALQAAAFPALTGDVTTTAGSLATTIANNAVTFAKMQDIATDSLIGRDTAATGDPENITLNATLSMTGAGALQRAALTGDVTAAAGSNATAFRSGLARSVLGVTGNATAVLADIQGTTDQVLRVNGAGTALAFGAIDLSKVAAATGIIQAASFPALTGDVTTASGAVATTIANGAVTYAKMQNVSATSRFLGRITALAGIVEELTGTQATSLLDVFTSALKGLVPASGGGTTTFLRADGTFAAPTGASGFATVNVQTFTTSGTFTPSASMKYCTIELVGGGGGGGGIAGQTGVTKGGAGGGAGGYSRKTVSVATVGASQTVTIGAAGTAGTSAGTAPGGNGGTTSVGTLCVANGGQGGGGDATGTGTIGGGAGGAIAGAVGDIVASGAPGNSGFYRNDVTSTLSGADGGSSFFGGGGLGAIFSSSSSAGGAASNHGSGGGGAQTTGSAANRAGGAGSAGFVIITEYI